ncbi:MAG: class I SAM-dependent methyltransferase [Patescibacteria group bacterium]
MEEFEKPPIDEKSDEEVFREYMEDLKLSPEDFNKKILDVGAGSAQFAKWAKEHGVSSEIYSLEPRKENLIEKEKGVVAKAETMPFADESFDLIVSNAAIPNIYLGESSESIQKKIRSSLDEMMRVLKSGGEIRLARVLIGKEYEPQRDLSKSIENALAELEKSGTVQVEKIRTSSDDTYEYQGHIPKKLLAEAYLIIIRKQKD